MASQSEWDADSNTEVDNNWGQFGTCSVSFNGQRPPDSYYYTTLASSGTFTTIDYSPPIAPYPNINCITVNFATSTWKGALGYAFGWILMPIMVILSKILKRSISIGNAS
jgi:hypothetical protein